MTSPSPPPRPHRVELPRVDVPPLPPGPLPPEPPDPGLDLVGYRDWVCRHRIAQLHDACPDCNRGNDGKGGRRGMLAWLAAPRPGEPSDLLPGQIVTPEREPMCSAGAAMHCEDPRSVERFLDERFLRCDGRWVEQVEVGGAPWVRAFLWVEKGDLRIETNSYARLQHLVYLFEQLWPPVWLGFSYSGSLADALRIHRNPGRLPEEARPPRFLGQLYEHAEEAVRRFERRWVLTPCRELGRRRPVDVAATPAGTRELWRFLDGVSRRPVAEVGRLALVDPDRVVELAASRPLPRTDRPGPDPADADQAS